MDSGWQLQMSDLLLAGFEERISFSHGQLTRNLFADTHKSF